MTAFADTSALFILMDADNTAHAATADVWDELHASGDDIVTTSYVMLEAFSLLQRRLGLVSARGFVERVVPLIEVEWVTAAEHWTAVDIVLTANRRDLSLVDCVSFEVMRRLGIRRAFALDEHFREQGFEVVP
jgi:predicted nucleic acid-binding protein